MGPAWGPLIIGLGAGKGVSDGYKYSNLEPCPCSKRHLEIGRSERAKEDGERRKGGKEEKQNLRGFSNAG